MVKKRSSYKMSKSTVLLIAFIAGALLVIFYQIYIMNQNSLATQIAVKTTVYDSLTTQGVFIREEKVLEQASGVVVQSVGDGGRVGKAEEVAKVFGSASAAQNYTKILQLQEKLDYYNDLQSQTLGEAADIKSMDQSILEAIGSIAQIKNGSALEQMAQLDMELNDVLIRRRLLTGETIDFTPIITQLQGQISSLQSAGAAPENVVRTDVSGNFVHSTDGYEDYFDYSKAAEYTVEEVKTFLADTAAKKPADHMGKMITNYNWYVACVVDSSMLSSVKVGSGVTICVSSNPSLELNATVYAKNMPSAQSGECALVLQCDAMEQDISSLRNEQLEIRLRPYSGLRIDNRSIRTVEGEKGVFALISNKVVFRKIEVLYSGDDFVIAAQNNGDKNNIQLYDAVIVEGRDLYDGKFIN